MEKLYKASFYFSGNNGSPPGRLKAEVETFKAGLRYLQEGCQVSSSNNVGKKVFRSSHEREASKNKIQVKSSSDSSFNFKLFMGYLPAFGVGWCQGLHSQKNKIF